MFNTQQLLFNQTPLVKTFKTSIPQSELPEDFYLSGFTTLSDIPNEERANEIIQTLIANVDNQRLPLLDRFLSRMKLAKADIIPICDDSVETSFQALHFDMGQPIISQKPQTMYLVIGLYFPMSKPAATARTRVLSLSGLLKNKRWGGQEGIEQALLSYVAKHGDGWADINTHRLQCFARIIDAVSKTSDLADYRDKTMAQWFQNSDLKDGQISLENEYQFYNSHNVDIRSLEEQITLQPGQLLIIDNTRVAHGRIGKRNAQEIYQFMYGVEKANSRDIKAFRKNLVETLAY